MSSSQLIRMSFCRPATPDLLASPIVSELLSSIPHRLREAFGTTRYVEMQPSDLQPSMLTSTPTTPKYTCSRSSTQLTLQLLMSTVAVHHSQCLTTCKSIPSLQRRNNSGKTWSKTPSSKTIPTLQLSSGILVSSESYTNLSASWPMREKQRCQTSLKA